MLKQKILKLRSMIYICFKCFKKLILLQKKQIQIKNVKRKQFTAKTLFFNLLQSSISKKNKNKTQKSELQKTKNNQ